MDITDSLYKGRLIRLGPIDHEKDPPIIAHWTSDPLWRAMSGTAPRPLSAEAVRKQLEKVEKQMEETKNLFHFTLRTCTDDRLVGLAKIYGIDFHNGTGILTLGIGEASDRRHGYGSDALTLLLSFAFGELNLNRLSAFLTSDNLPCIKLLEKAGFEQEVFRRESDYHEGRYWDGIDMGLLRSKWEMRQ